ncbi:MAG: hypothetical protein GEU96_01745 [Propionibacteriales bacterium]|nr:hypothetical protein [Propionibacteriales bacterium]
MEPAELAAWQTYLAEPFSGRKVILAFQVLASLTPKVTALRTYGAQQPLLITRGRGVGPIPEPGAAIVCELDLAPVTTMTEEVREVIRESAEPSRRLAEIVEAEDPGRTAVWWLPPFARNEPLLGRTVYGGRPAAWETLEDKMRAEEIFDAAGVPRARSRILPVDHPDLMVVGQDIDLGHGTVWSGDARDGMNGGADYVRWVDGPDDARDARDFFAAHCDRVRVLPFLEGVPCSIHGFVLPDGVAAFRPLELVVLRTPSRRSFVFGGMGTWWDPRPADREAMRDVAHRIGAWLGAEVGYRGGFGVDGVLTRDGFLPTEVNPRFTAGLTTLARTVAEVPLELLQVNVLAGRDPMVPTAALERMVVEAADQNRGGKLIGMSARPAAAETQVAELYGDGDRLTPEHDGGRPAGTLSLGGTPSGSFCSFEHRDGLLRAGERMAPLNAAVLRCADELWDAGFGPVEAAAEVRR